MTQEDINKLGNLITRKNDFEDDTLSLNRYIEYTKRKDCAVFYDKDCKALKKFHPLFPLDDWWLDEFIKRNGIRLCELYYPPYNFKRTGCVCCPFSLDLQEQLDKLAIYLPTERKRAEYLWRTVYAEYRRIGYRLRPLGLFDMEFVNV